MSILLSHTQNEYASNITPFVHDFLAVSNFAVPFFFACSGFLFFSKVFQLQPDERFSYYKMYSIRLGKTYLAWTIIYFSFNVITWTLYGVTETELINYFHRFIVITSYPTIWFLPALWIGISIIFLLYSKGVNSRNILIISCCLYFICSMGENYNLLLQQFSIANTLIISYKTVFIAFRNGFLMGAPFVCIGYLLAVKNNISSKTSFILTLVFSVLFVFESYIIRRFHFSDYSHCGLFLFPATYFLLAFLIKFELRNRSIYIWLRNLSILTFLSQRLILTAIPGVLPQFGVYLTEMEPYSTILFVFAIVMSISIIIIKLSEKYKILKVLW